MNQNRLALFVILASVSFIRAQEAQLTSWLTNNTGLYARIYTTAANTPT